LLLDRIGISGLVWQRLVFTLTDLIPNRPDSGPDAVADALLALPLGTFRGQALGKTWLVTRSLFVGGASEKLVAHALDGTDYISMNLYRLASGSRLKPCEMPAARVVRFVLDLVPET
tara:strand:+ start:3758 stop:4108 length:351 start_codon:yes stop_codon:yes gene_type:complete